MTLTLMLPFIVERFNDFVPWYFIRNFLSFKNSVQCASLWSDAVQKWSENGWKGSKWPDNQNSTRIIWLNVVNFWIFLKLNNYHVSTFLKRALKGDSALFCKSIIPKYWSSCIGFLITMYDDDYGKWKCSDLENQFVSTHRKLWLKCTLFLAFNQSGRRSERPIRSDGPGMSRGTNQRANNLPGIR